MATMAAMGRAERDAIGVEYVDDNEMAAVEEALSQVRDDDAIGWEYVDDDDAIGVDYVDDDEMAAVEEALSQASQHSSCVVIEVEEVQQAEGNTGGAGGRVRDDDAIGVDYVDDEEMAAVDKALSQASHRGTGIDTTDAGGGGGQEEPESEEERQGTTGHGGPQSIGSDRHDVISVEYVDDEEMAAVEESVSQVSQEVEIRDLKMLEESGKHAGELATQQQQASRRGRGEVCAAARPSARPVCCGAASSPHHDAAASSSLLSARGEWGAIDAPVPAQGRALPPNVVVPPPEREDDAGSRRGSYSSYAATHGRGSGVYVLELRRRTREGMVTYYVGKSGDRLARIQQQEGGGEGAAEWVKEHGGVARAVAPLTEGTQGDLSVWEMQETIERILLHGIRNVRGWEFDSVRPFRDKFTPVKANIMGLKDFCRKCGQKGHFAAGCGPGRGKAEWLRELEEFQAESPISNDDLKGISATLARSGSGRCNAQRHPGKRGAQTAPDDVCSVCGREGHVASQCYAKTYSDGRAMRGHRVKQTSGCHFRGGGGKEEEEWRERCGREGHAALFCYASKDADGGRLRASSARRVAVMRSTGCEYDDEEEEEEDGDVGCLISDVFGGDCKIRASTCTQNMGKLKRSIGSGP